MFLELLTLSQKKKSIPAIEIGYPSWKTVVTLVQCSECSHIYYLNPPSQDAINQFYKSSWKSEAEDSKVDSSALPQMINEKLAYLMADLGINNPENKMNLMYLDDVIERIKISINSQDGGSNLFINEN